MLKLILSIYSVQWLVIRNKLGILIKVVFNPAIFVNFINLWYICPRGLGSLSVVAYLGRSEKASIPNVVYGSWVMILHMAFVSMIRSLSSFLISGTKRGVP